MYLTHFITLSNHYPIIMRNLSANTKYYVFAIFESTASRRSFCDKFEANPTQNKGVRPVLVQTGFRFPGFPELIKFDKNGEFHEKTRKPPNDLRFRPPVSGLSDVPVQTELRYGYPGNPGRNRSISDWIIWVSQMRRSISGSGGSGLCLHSRGFPHTL